MVETLQVLEEFRREARFKTVKRLAVIGLDGESWSEIMRYRRLFLSTNRLISIGMRFLITKKIMSNKTSIFMEFKKKYNCATLTCDAEVTHTVPAWILAFSGVPLSKHGIACYYKPNGDLWKRSDFNYSFIWEDLTEKGLACKVLTFKAFGINYGVKVTVGNDILIPTTYNESLRNIQWATDKVNEQLAKQPNLFVYTSPFPDHGLHLRKSGKITETQYMNIRRKQDKFLRSLLPYLKRQDFIIMSDHGHPFILNGKWNWNGQEDSNHHPEGIIITNLPNPPQKLSEVYPYIMEYFT